MRTHPLLQRLANAGVRLGLQRVEALLDEADFFGDLFELTEGAERLGFLVDLLLQRHGQTSIRGDNVES